MKQTINELKITGVLVNNTLEVKDQFQENEAIAGHLTLRTMDGSEHDIEYFAYKFKKDKDTKQFTNEENGLYKGYETIMNDTVSLKDNPENPSIIQIGNGEISIRDYKSKQDGSLITFNSIRATFANRVDDNKKETIPQTATFKVSGVISKMEDEVVKGLPTGDKLIILDIIGYNGKLIPIKLKLKKELVQPFMSSGFYQGGCGQFSGNIINCVEEKEVVTKQTFGEDLIEKKTVITKGLMITGGSPLQLSNLEITEQEYEAAKSKRRLKLEEIMNEKSNQQQGFTPMNNMNTPSQPENNPFAQSNPFSM